MARIGRWIFGCQIYFPNLNIAFHPVHPLHYYINDEIRPKTISTLKGVLLSHGPPGRGNIPEEQINIYKGNSFSNHIQAPDQTFGKIWFWNHGSQTLFLVHGKGFCFFYLEIFRRQILGCKALACTGGVCVVEADSCPFSSCSSIEK